MADVRELQRKLDSSKALREIVNAMRNLAAIYVRRADGAIEAIRPYSETVQTALRVVLDRMGARAATPEDEGCRVAVVFASDQGLCGTYNDRVVRAALKFRDESPLPVHVMAIGLKGRALLEISGVKPILVAPAPTSLEGIVAQVAELAVDLFEAYVASGATEMHFIYNAYEGMGRFREHVQPVLPPSRDRLGERPEAAYGYGPLLTAPPAELLGAFAEEYFFIELYRALLESHASENGARLLAMTAAGTNIDERITELTKLYQSARQDAITSELLDVVGGAEALQQER